MAISLAACGSSSSSGEAAPAAEETEEAVEETEEAAEETEEAAEAEGPLADGVLTVGTNATFPPFEYLGDDGTPDGFDMALIKAIGEKIGVEVEIQDMEFSTLVQSIGTKIDIAIAGMTVTPERQETVDFSEPYYDAVQYVLLPVDSEIRTYEDLEGKKIAVQLGTTGNFIAEEIEGAELATYDKATDACNDLVNGRADCMIIDKNPAEVFQGKFSDKLVAVDGAQFSFEVENYAIAMPKGDTELAEKINGALQELKEDGTFDQLVEDYITNYSAE